MTSSQRQAALRERRRIEGRRQYVFWLTAEEQEKVKSHLAAGLPEAGFSVQEKRVLEQENFDLRNRLFEAQNQLGILQSITAERDSLKSLVEHMRRTNSDLSMELDRTDEGLEQAEATIKSLRAQLQEAEVVKGEKPAKAMAAPDLPDRRGLIFKDMTTTLDYVTREPKERPPYDLKAKADLAKKFVTEIKNARSRLATLINVAYGENSLDQSKSRATLGSWVKFEQPIISDTEKDLLLEAATIMSRIEGAVERAGEDVAKLHDQREAEHKERVRQASEALDRLLFSSLDRRGEALFLTVQGDSHGDWSDLVAAAKKGEVEPWKKTATELFKEGLNDAKSRLAHRMADVMKTTGQSAEELAKGIVEKYRHPDTEEKNGELANLVTTFLVSEQLRRAK